jgi:HAD superfamily hydrolase (TIGR01509 family)
MKLEALIFDLDGTLVDTEELHRQSYNQTFLDFGFGWSWSQDSYAELLTVSGGEARIARYLDLADLLPAEKTRLRRLIPAVHRQKTRLYGELIESNGIHPRPGAARLIEEAKRAGVSMGVVASSAAANVDALLTSAFGRDARNAMMATVSADVVSRKKPAPDIYELVLTMLRASADASVAFEDSTNGLLAAKAVGLYTVVTPSRWTIRQRFQGADLLLSSLGDPHSPLNSADAGRIGAPYLELSKIEALRSAKSPSRR